MSESRARVWAFIVYEDSAPEDWLQQLRDLHVPIAVSPVHAADGTDVKPHYHILAQYDGKKSYAQVREVVDLVHGAGPIAVQSVRGYARYLCHLDDDDKPTYDPREVVCMSGFDYAQHLAPTPTDYKSIVREIDAYILQYDVTELCLLLDHAMREEPTWYEVLQSPGQLMRFSRIIASARYSETTTTRHRKRLRDAISGGTLKESK